jgi:hypothetical protein
MYYKLKSLQIILVGGDSRIHNVIDFNNGIYLPLSMSEITRPG